MGVPAPTPAALDMVLYRKPLTQTARALRRRMTDAELTLWRRLREAAPELRFRRQVPIGPFVVDFASHDCKLVVEVDGSQHHTIDGLAADAARDASLAQDGYRVLRFTNLDVLTNADGVVTAILDAVHQDTTPMRVPVRGGAPDR